MVFSQDGVVYRFERGTRAFTVELLSEDEQPLRLEFPPLGPLGLDIKTVRTYLELLRDDLPGVVDMFVALFPALRKEG